MLRVRDLDKAMNFYCNGLGLKEVRRVNNEKGRFTLVFLCAPDDEGVLANSKGRGQPLVELTYNYDTEDYGDARYFGHLAYEVDNIYETCAKLQKMGIVINRPPRDGQMAFVRSPVTSRSSCCRRARHCRRPSRGPRCRTSGIGERAGFQFIVIASAARSNRNQVCGPWLLRFARNDRKYHEAPNPWWLRRPTSPTQRLGLWGQPRGRRQSIPHGLPLSPHLGRRRRC